MGRLLEATQFQIQDYEAFKGGAKFENQAKQKAMELLAIAEKDPKHEINTTCGGISNVKRVRVLKDSDDAELKDLKLNFELKTPAQELRRREFEKEREANQERARIERLKSRQFPVFFSDARASVVAILTVTADEAEKIGMPEALFKPLREIRDALEISEMSVTAIDDLRVRVSELIGFSSDGDEADPEKKAFKVVLFRRLDLSQAMLCFLLYEKAFDKEELLAYAKKLLPVRPQQQKGPPKGKPQQRRGPSNLPPFKPQTPPQA